MKNPAQAYAVGFFLLGCWGVFAGATKPFKAAAGWSRRRGLLFGVGVLFLGSCFACALGLWFGWFARGMLLPLGASYLAMIPLPCYFEAVDRIPWLHAARNVLFLLVAGFCFLFGLGALPMSLLGL